MGVAAVAAGLLALGGQAAAQLGDDAVHRGEVGEWA
jgi:predicted regulator of Ras-like GTPase activity (Roadblock/LC7/MglB family)